MGYACVFLYYSKCLPSTGPRARKRFRFECVHIQYLFQPQSISTLFLSQWYILSLRNELRVRGLVPFTELMRYIIYISMELHGTVFRGKRPYAAVQLGVRYRPHPHARNKVSEAVV
jgi:hypothetical protein